MAVLNHSTLDRYQADVIQELTGMGVACLSWHSGGGIVGVLIQCGTSTLFSTLAADRQPGWTGFDWNDNDGDMIGVLEITERPHGHKPLYVGDEPATPHAMAQAIYNATSHLR